MSCLSCMTLASVRRTERLLPYTADLIASTARFFAPGSASASVSTLAYWPMLPGGMKMGLERNTMDVGVFSMVVWAVPLLCVL